MGEKNLRKEYKGVKEIIAIFSFLTYISIENYTLMWIKEDKTKNKIFIFPGVVDLLQNFWGSAGSACITERERSPFQNFLRNILINAALE